MFDKVLVVNRGEIARRILRTLRRLEIPSLVVHSEADRDMPFVAEADEAALIDGRPDAAYRDVGMILEVARGRGADAVHPGYGFLSENAAAATALTAAGLTWIGPPSNVIEVMGDKIRARNLAVQAGVPVASGSADPVADEETALRLAKEIGYPIMVKAAAGGGGMGMQVATDEATLKRAFLSVRGMAERSFGSPDVLLERYFPRVRHVEVQVLGLANGTVVELGERDCSVQRRNQKLAEETPAPGLSPRTRECMRAAAVDLAKAIGYRSAGTMEFLVDPSTQEFFFLEMNTRLQVEHPVTETVYGVDLVEEMLRIAAGLDPTFAHLSPAGHAIEFRINAEEPPLFIPRPGKITRWDEPRGEGVRVDSGYAVGCEVPPFYDSLMGKLIVHGADRTQALVRMRQALRGFAIEGPGQNLSFFEQLLRDPDYCLGDYDTSLVTRMQNNA
ncbi:biotin carboxylase [Intrasporangium chromatireducens Q5-1]|uniref:biotin carboxylase n=1 Tax=Intrasporangium chromatireducens Q5-1 TaxID=584657 RepID=W9GJJ2_9MICO|nr:biotin carboxylase N-terminal domain-containing protein [Intrasporangium chromatireducens]EWT05322.1 biotin carboxylase [Intrasporangium chromatireducens Q5-1]